MHTHTDSNPRGVFNADPRGLQDLKYYFKRCSCCPAAGQIGFFRLKNASQNRALVNLAEVILFCVMHFKLSLVYQKMICTYYICSDEEARVSTHRNTLRCADTLYNYVSRLRRLVDTSFPPIMRLSRHILSNDYEIIRHSLSTDYGLSRHSLYTDNEDKETQHIN